MYGCMLYSASLVIGVPWLMLLSSIKAINTLCAGTLLEEKVQQVVQGTADGVAEGIRIVAFEQDRRRPPTLNASSSAQQPPGACGPKTFGLHTASACCYIPGSHDVLLVTSAKSDAPRTQLVSLYTAA